MKVDRQALLDILKAGAAGIASKEVIENSASYIFDQGWVLTFNDEVCVSQPVDLPGLTGAVSAKEFLSLLGKIKDKEIDIEVEGGLLMVTAKRKKAGVKMTADTEAVLDIINGVGVPEEWLPLPEGFIEAMDFCLPTVGTDPTRPLQTCICFEGALAYANDNRRMSRHLVANGDFNPPILLPAIGAKELDVFNPVEYGETIGWLHFRSAAGTVFSCRGLGGASYPTKDIDNIIAGFVKINEVDLPPDLSEALDLAGLFSVNSDLVRVTIADGLLTVKGEGENGFAEETARVKMKGDPVDFGISSKMLQDILGHTDKAIIGKGVLMFKGDAFVHVIALYA